MGKRLTQQINICAGHFTINDIVLIDIKFNVLNILTVYPIV